MSLIFIKTLALLWAGMILGISFFESWVKFKAPSLDKVTGLDVGRTVFSYFHYLQLVLLSFLIFLNLIDGLLWMQILLLFIITSTLILQIFWLFPILCQRVTELAQGKVLSSSNAHVFYGISELVKFCALVTLGLIA